MAKLAIVEALEEKGLLLPELVDAALAANDRVKYRFALLQGACAHADAPSAVHGDLAAERRLAGIEDASLDEIIANARRTAEDAYALPQAGRLVRSMLDETGAMLQPLRMATEQSIAGPEEVAAYETRLAALAAELRTGGEDTIAPDLVEAATSARRGERDSLHLLVMDLHKAINALQRQLANETVAGARAYGVTDWDRARIAAFMRGLDSTARLKFDHPGLGTVATRSGAKLVIQNEIGTTDAHVLVVHVEPKSVTCFYTDVHIQRLEFFQSLFEKFPVTWQDTRSRRTETLNQGEAFYLCNGRFEAGSEAELDACLGFLGSRIVFLIDWNRARKRLQTLVRRSDAIGLLKWAADNDLGHRAFLEFGGERLVFDAVAAIAKAPVRAGEKLHETLGDEAAVNYLRFVLRSCTEGMLEHRSPALIHDEIRAELTSYFSTVGERLFDLVCDQACLVTDMAADLQKSLLRLGLAGAERDVTRAAHRLKEWETRADALVGEIRTLAGKTGTGASGGAELFDRLTGAIDDAADAFEEAGFLLTLLTPPPAASDTVQQMRRLGELGGMAAREFVKLLEAARHVHRGGARIDVQDFLTGVDRTIALERDCDEVERQVQASLVREAQDFRQLHVGSRVAAGIESTTDALRHAALILRDHILNEVMAH
jgi:uncharacterized protein Yka (UPF0111/DUF47 family)